MGGKFTEDHLLERGLGPKQCARNGFQTNLFCPDGVSDKHILHERYFEAKYFAQVGWKGFFTCLKVASRAHTMMQPCFYDPMQ